MIVTLVEVAQQSDVFRDRDLKIVAWTVYPANLFSVFLQQARVVGSQKSLLRSSLMKFEDRSELKHLRSLDHSECLSIFGMEYVVAPHSFDSVSDGQGRYDAVILFKVL